MNTNQTVPSFQYPTNEDGEPEYQSVIITLDHLSAGREGNPHIHNKFVFSTQDELEAILALFGYYGEATLGMRPDFIKMAGELFHKDFPLMVYQTAPNPETGFKGNTELVLAMDTFIELINNDNFGHGSILMAVERVVQIHNRIVVDKLAGHPEGSRLAPWGFELEVQADEPTTGDPQNSPTESSD